MSLNQAFVLSRRNRTIVGKIVKKRKDQYVLEDKKGRQFFARSILSFEIGKTVISKDGLILNIVNNLEDFTSYIV